MPEQNRSNQKASHVKHLNTGFHKFKNTCIDAYLYTNTYIKCAKTKRRFSRNQMHCFNSYSSSALSWCMFWADEGTWRVEGSKQSLKKKSWKDHTVIKMDALLTMSDQQLLNLGDTWKSLSILLYMEVNRLFGLRTPYYSNLADPESHAIFQWQFGGLCHLDSGFGIS